MSADPNKKSARTFQCRDVLWETFEQMARELECSVDYLVNESMKQYARARSQAPVRTPLPHRAGELSQSAEGAMAAPLPPPPTPGGSMPVPARAAARPGMPAPLPPPPSRVPPPPPAGRSSAPIPRAPAPPPLGRPPGAPPSMPPIPRTVATPPPIGLSRSVAPPPLAPPPGRVAPPPMPGTAPANGTAVPNGASLTLIYNGERHPITKDRFVIGRGKQSSDLMLKDPNVSRQHALVEFLNGSYFMVDMGSTNGVTYNGDRVSRQAIAEGDLFRICDHDLQFTYR
jgi:hypothetical protein